MSEQLKKSIISSWAQSGLTCEDVKGFIKKSDGAFAAYMDTFYDTLPLLAAGVPLMGGSLTYMLTHPDVVKDRLRSERIKKIRQEAAQFRGGRKY